MKNIIKNNPIVGTFKIALGGMLGVLSAYALVGIFSLVFVGLGLLIMIKYNKKPMRPYFEELSRIDKYLISTIEANPGLTIVSSKGFIF